MTMPWHDRLMQALCAYDLIGFQTSNDLRNFHDYLYREGIGYGLADGLVQAFDRTLRAQDFPIGIDAEEFAQMALSPEAVRTSQRLSRSLLGRKLIIGVDRLDYSKGIPERLRAFETLLQNYPEQRRQVTLVQSRRRRAKTCRNMRRSARRWRRPRGGSMAASASSTGRPSLHQSRLHETHARRVLSSIARGPGHPAARRHEPGRQGIRRGPAGR